MAATFTAAISRPGNATSASAARTPSNQAAAASWASSPALEENNSWGTRARATTWPAASTATALTDVVPISIPIVTALGALSAMPNGLADRPTPVLGLFAVALRPERARERSRLLTRVSGSAHIVPPSQTTDPK